ncbi:hypothetical protein MN086_04635 [Sulfurovum sp. XGS-02]|uniref:hypothetical protein n=1 Tax=Sulfurovum sp. XGS-02 TaxID=2925411 RepID=UPI002059951B|nr:hypothetical protein [Sulfurovum sp. XGS-02]UPT78437.1 hypothetical protein MN086_04635 [Sulfurovum sp. XGS-02]
MIKNKIHYILVATILLGINGCGTDTAEPDKKKRKVSGFHTDRSMFIATIDEVSPTKEERNALIDEFIMKSNLQCQHYLNNPLNTSSTPKKQGLYMDIFDGVSQAFGVKNITDGAKKLYIKKSEDGSNKAKIAYENALSPEIKRGVEIAREKYVQKMILRRTRMIESYTIAMMERDMDNYDKLCSYETGLIEIHKALKKAQRQPKIKPFSPKIDPTTIKNKVEAVTREAQANKASNAKIDVKVLNAKESGKESQSQTVSQTEELNRTAF